MATITFSALPSLANITAATIVPVVAGNINYQVTAANLQSYVNGGAGNITSNNITATGVVQGATISATGLVQGATVSAIGNVIGGNIIFGTGIVSGTGNIFATNITATGVSATSNVIGGNLLTSGAVSATGNVTGNYLLANIFYATGYSVSKIYNGTSQANIPVANGNIAFTVGGNTVETIAPAGQYVTGLISATGNVYTPIVYANTLMQSGAITNLGSYTGPSMFIATDGNITTGGKMSAIGNTSGGNLTTTGQVSATGNITGGNLITNGSFSIAGNITTGGNVLVNGSLSIAGTTTLHAYVETTTSQGTVTTSFTPNMSSGPVQTITAAGNFILNAPTNMSTGSSITLIITQDATGNRIMTPNAAYKFAYSVNTLSNAGNAIDVLSIFYSGSNYLCNLVRSYT